MAPSGRVADAVALMRSPHALPYMPYVHMQYALKVLAAMSAGDWHSWLRLRGSAPAASLRAILDMRTGQVGARVPPWGT
ncbi:hypothetical protein GPECTOR_49g492 [Gonium pectorale]|uniref:Uncharacterized protein n=1 Tax=Gonium pectorale TaxID=33097 RepID=A0A150G7V8_GONPE|nr:hypothetical protein GPECTOR_49g492 [Gonium pectorale]|eukprot:KXZ45908.1 hypothetical protein GPECTOR_49g492 [Gonium pectorale]